MNMVSKSQFKARALEFFRKVERTGRELVITDRGTPVLKLIPYTDVPRDTLRILRDTVGRYEAPTKSVGEDEWEAGQDSV